MAAAERVLLVLFGVLLSAGPAFAQGRSDAAPGKAKDKAPSKQTRSSQSGRASPATATSSTSAPIASANSVVYYGSWLDDASIVEPRDVWIGLASG